MEAATGLVVIGRVKKVSNTCTFLRTLKAKRKAALEIHQRPNPTLKFAPFGRRDAPSARPLAPLVGRHECYRCDESIMSEGVKVIRRPIRATIYALVGTLFTLFSAFAFYVSQKDQTTVAFLHSLFIGAFFLSDGVFLYWRSWLNFAGTADEHQIDFTSPVGQTIAVSVVAAKGLSDLPKTHFGEAAIVITLVGFVICALAPLVVWWRTRSRHEQEAERT